MSRDGLVNHGLGQLVLDHGVLHLLQDWILGSLQILDQYILALLGLLECSHHFGELVPLVSQVLAVVVGGYVAVGVLWETCKHEWSGRLDYLSHVGFHLERRLVGSISVDFACELPSRVQRWQTKLIHLKLNLIVLLWLIVTYLDAFLWLFLEILILTPQLLIDINQLTWLIPQTIQVRLQFCDHGNQLRLVIVSHPTLIVLTYGITWPDIILIQLHVHKIGVFVIFGATGTLIEVFVIDIIFSLFSIIVSQKLMLLTLHLLIIVLFELA